MMTRLVLVSRLSFLSQLPLFVLVVWIFVAALHEGAHRRTNGGTHEECNLLPSLLVTGGCVFSCFVTSMGLLYWSVLEDQLKLQVRLCRCANLSNCCTGLILVLLQFLCWRFTGDVGHDATTDLMFLGCGAISFFLSSLCLMLSVCGKNNNHEEATVHTDPSQSSLLEPLLSGTDDERGLRLETGDVEEDEEVQHETREQSDSEVSNSEATSRWSGMRRLLQLAAPQVSFLYAGCAVLLLRLPFSLSIPHFVSSTISAVQNGDFDAAVHEILCLVLAGSIDAALDFWCVFLFGYANLRIVRGVRVDLYSKLIRQEVAFFDQTSSGELSSRLQSDCSEMAGDLTWFFRFSIESVVRILGITIYMFLRNPILASCSLGVSPLIAVVNKLYGNWLRDNAVQVQTALAAANEVAIEAISNIRTVIAFATEPAESQRYKDRIQKHYQLNVKQLIMTGVYYMAISTFLINTVVQALLLFIGSRLVQADKLTPQVLLAFMLYQGQLQNETLNLFQSYSSLIKSSGAGDKVFQLLDRKPPAPSMISEEVVGCLQRDNTTEHPFVPPKQEPYSIELDAVSFTYPARPLQPILKGLHLKFPPGTSTAIVGTSGSGKSTICHLLQRFYDPEFGSILVDGVDLKTLNLIGYRRRIGVVSQETLLFQGTILENIIYGCDGATREDAVQAARVAFADHFIVDFPNGYDTIVGERGVQLSGGQRQRISIARAVIKKPSLLLLDEATSALDTASEQIVQEAIDNLLREKSLTSVVVAHRLQTVQTADFIAVLHHGQVVEYGSHGELILRSQGLYRSMVQRAGPTGMLSDEDCCDSAFLMTGEVSEQSGLSQNNGSPNLREASRSASIDRENIVYSPTVGQSNHLGSNLSLAQASSNLDPQEPHPMASDSVQDWVIDVVLDATIDSLLDDESDVSVQQSLDQTSAS